MLMNNSVVFSTLKTRPIRYSESCNFFIFAITYFCNSWV